MIKHIRLFKIKLLPNLLQAMQGLFPCTTRPHAAVCTKVDLSFSGKKAKIKETKYLPPKGPVAEWSPVIPPACAALTRRHCRLAGLALVYDDLLGASCRSLLKI